jgi:ATP/maltotriose-dependent transcriptional regulator MalT
MGGPCWCSPRPCGPGARLRGDAPEVARLARRALSLLPDGEARVRSYAAVRLGDGLRAVGDLAAEEAYAEAVEIGRFASHAYVRLAAMVMHAEVRAEQGRLWEADESFRQAVRLLSESGFELSPAAGVVRIGMADLLYERDDVDGAERDLERGVELAERTGDVSTLVWAYVTLSRTERARGTRGALSKGPARRSASPATPAPICRSPSPRPGWRGCAWRRETSRKLAPSNGSAPRTRTAPLLPCGPWTG